MSDSNPWVELPPCEIGRLEDINEVRVFLYHTIRDIHVLVHS